MMLVVSGSILLVIMIQTSKSRTKFIIYVINDQSLGSHLVSFHFISE
jgi:hypothetical protein